MKIAVTAASGQLGKEIVKASIALLTKDDVVGLARTLDKADNTSHFYEASGREHESWQTYFANTKSNA